MKTLPVLTLSLLLAAAAALVISSRSPEPAFSQDSSEAAASVAAPGKPTGKPGDGRTETAGPDRTDPGQTATSGGTAANGTPESGGKSRASADEETSGAGKTVLRRNEQSGATALRTLQQAHDRLNGYRFIDARLDQTVRMGGRKFRMSGRYFKGADLKLRLEYEVQVGGTSGRLVEVCDGQLLWTHSDIGGQQRVTRRNVQQIISAASQAGFTTQNVLTAELGLGGLQGLLASLQKSIQFEAQWEQDAGGRTFVVIEGVWKRSFREKVLGPNVPLDRPMPPAVPDQVRLYFEQDSLFPRRIVYLKQEADGRRVPMVTIDFTEVSWPDTLDDSLFTFKPPATVAPEDVTQAYVNRFKPPDTASGTPAAGTGAPGTPAPQKQPADSRP